MDWPLLIGGAALVIAAVLDVVWTSLWVGGSAGPFVRVIARACWIVIKAADRNHKVMVLAGPAILVLTVVGWILLLWGGWILVFSSEPASIVTTSSNMFSDFVDRVYFVGYTIFTLGIGDFLPNGHVWQIMTTLAAGSGLFAATLAVTYLLSVVSAAVSGRAFAAEVAGLGPTAADAVAAGWDGRSYVHLSFPLQSASSQLSKLGQQYLAYPVLQYFHAGKPSQSPIIALARLEQILAISSRGVPERERAPPGVLHNSVGSAIDSVLNALPSHFTKPAGAPLPLPDLGALHTQGRATVNHSEFEVSLSTHELRRKKLRALLKAYGWDAEDIYRTNGSEHPQHNFLSNILETPDNAWVYLQSLMFVSNPSMSGQISPSRGFGSPD